MKHYHADSEGHYDIQAVMRDIKNADAGKKKIKIDIEFGAYAPKLLKELRGQEDYYKK